MSSKATNARLVPANDRGVDPWLEWKRDVMAGFWLFVFLTAVFIILGS